MKPYQCAISPKESLFRLVIEAENSSPIGYNKEIERWKIFFHRESLKGQNLIHFKYVNSLNEEPSFTYTCGHFQGELSSVNAPPPKKKHKHICKKNSASYRSMTIILLLNCRSKKDRSYWAKHYHTVQFGSTPSMVLM